MNVTLQYTDSDNDDYHLVINVIHFTDKEPDPYNWSSDWDCEGYVDLDWEIVSGDPYEELTYDDLEKITTLLLAQLREED